MLKAGNGELVAVDVFYRKSDESDLNLIQIHCLYKGQNCFDRHWSAEISEH